MENNFESFEDFTSTGNDESTINGKSGNVFDGDDWGIVDEGEESSEQSEKSETSETGERETKEEGEKVSKDSQVNNLEDSEEKEGSPKEKEAPAKKDDESDEDTEKSEDDEAAKDSDGEESGDGEREVSKSLKLVDGDKAYEVPETAEIKVKVDGKWEKVPLNELKDQYSGKVAWDEKFTKLSDEKNEFEKQSNEYNQEIEEIRGEMSNIASKVKEAMEGNAHPLEAFTYLLDLMGADSLSYNKSMYESLSDDMLNYSDMTDDERESYWNKKELASIKNKQESERQRSTEVQTQEEHSQKIQNLREAHGVNEEDYSFAENELKAMGYKDVTPEMIVRTSIISDNIMSVESLVEPYSDNLSDEEAKDLISNLAVSMYEEPSITLEDIKSELASRYKIPEVVEALVSKNKEAESLSTKSGSRTQSAKVHNYESFEDL